MLDNYFEGNNKACKRYTMVREKEREKKSNWSENETKMRTSQMISSQNLKNGNFHGDIFGNWSGSSKQWI